MRAVSASSIPALLCALCASVVKLFLALGRYFAPASFRTVKSKFRTMLVWMPHTTRL